MRKIYLALLLLLAIRISLFFLAGPPASPAPVVPLLETRLRFMALYQDVLPSRQANLLSGIVLGSVGLDAKFKAKLADVGLTHIVAASGMNITLFSGFATWLLSLLKLRRMYKVILSMAFILLYSGLTGFEPPIVRAALMAIFTYAALLLGRRGAGLGGLLMSAYLMLWVSPWLLTSASFLLSFSAMTGQIFLGSFRFEVPKILELIIGDFVQSFLAIVFTFPIVLWFFAKFSLVSLLSNSLVLWTIEPLMILGGLISLSGLVSAHLARLVALPAEPLLAYFLWIVDILGQDVFLFKFKLDSPIFVVGYYLALGGFIWWWTTSRRSVN